MAHDYCPCESDSSYCSRRLRQTNCSIRHWRPSFAAPDGLHPSESFSVGRASSLAVGRSQSPPRSWQKTNWTTLVQPRHSTVSPGWELIRPSGFSWADRVSFSPVTAQPIHHRWEARQGDSVAGMVDAGVQNRLRTR